MTNKQIAPFIKFLKCERKTKKKKKSEKEKDKKGRPPHNYELCKPRIMRIIS